MAARKPTRFANRQKARYPYGKTLRTTGRALTSAHPAAATDILSSLSATPRSSRARRFRNLFGLKPNMHPESVKAIGRYERSPFGPGPMPPCHPSSWNDCNIFQNEIASGGA